MRIPDTIKQAARDLRKNMTPAEEILWNKLKAKRFMWKKFMRQFPLYVYTEDSWLDRYIIPDFICHENKIIIEVDGNIHDTGEIIQLDNVKNEIIERLWFEILRFKNEEILNNVDEVLIKIKTKI